MSAPVLIEPPRLFLVAPAVKQEPPQDFDLLIFGDSDVPALELQYQQPEPEPVRDGIDYFVEKLEPPVLPN